MSKAVSLYLIRTLDTRHILHILTSALWRRASAVTAGRNIKLLEREILARSL